MNSLLTTVLAQKREQRDGLLMEMENDWQRFCDQAKKAAADGKHGYAETSWIAALQETEEFGDTDERLVQTLEGLYETYWNQGKFRQAEKPAHQLLAIATKIHGSEHLLTADAAQRLASVYHMQQKYGQAEPLYKQALTYKSKGLVAQNPDLVRLLESYANLLQKTDRQAEAEAILARARSATPAAIARNRTVAPANALNPGRPTPIPSSPPAENDVIVEVQQKTWEDLRDEAEKTLQSGDINRSLEIWQQAVNVAEKFPVQEKLALSLDRVGEILFKAERYGQAEMVWWRALQIKLSALGEMHQAVAHTANQLAGLHYLLGRYAEAEAYTKRCREIYKVVSGPRHPNVAVCMHNLASLYHVQGKYGDAEEQYVAAMQLRKSVLGVEHPDTVSVTKSYADLLKTLGRDSEANALNSLSSGLITGSWKALELDVEELLTEQYIKAT